MKDGLEYDCIEHSWVYYPLYSFHVLYLSYLVDNM